MSGGESNYVHFGFESTFKGAATANKVFGENVSIRSVDLKNNVRRLFRLGSRSAMGHVAGKMEGALSLEFDINPNDPWFLQGVIGTCTTSGSATSAYWHTFVETNKPLSLTIENGISGVVRKYLGCIIGDCKISTAVGDEPAKCSLTVTYADEQMCSGTTTQIQSSGAVMPFSYGDIQYPTGTSIANTESVEMTITNTAALKWALGSRKASRYDMRQRTYDVTTTNYFDDANSYLRRVYGSTGVDTPNTMMVSGEAGITISLNNGQVSASDKKVFTFTFTSATIERHSLGTQNVETEQMETIDIIPESCLIQVINQASGMVG